jgi:tRNA/rRNA methyltransferase
MNPTSPLANIRVVLCQTSHPGNIGAAARAIKTMGITRLVLVNPRDFPSDEASARSSGALDVLENARVVDTLKAALDGTVLAAGLTARRRDLSHAPLTPRQAAPRLLAEAACGEVALVFGSETNGLSNAELDHCQMLIHIPGNPDYSTLNVAAAVQVLAYELRAGLGDAALPPPQVNYADLADVERYYEHLEQTLIRIGFLDPAQPGRLMQRLRRLYARTRLEKEELAILRGILTETNKSCTSNK